LVSLVVHIQLRGTSATLQKGDDSLLIDEGSGLLIPKGILAAGDNPSDPLDEKRRDCCAVGGGERSGGSEGDEAIIIEKLTLRAAVEWVELQPGYEIGRYGADTREKQKMYSTASRTMAADRESSIDYCKEENRDVLAGGMRDKAAVLRGATARAWDDK
jgi:hypothetical protein